MSILKRLSSTSAGLSGDEAAARLARFGPNLLHPAKKRVLYLFCRVNPAQKNRVILALKNGGML